MKRSHFLAGSLSAAAVPNAAFAASIGSRIRAAVREIPGTAGVYARTMSGGPPFFAYNQDLSFASASTIKLLILLTAFQRAARDPHVMRAPVTFRRAALIGGSDFLAGKSDGERFTVHELLLPMIQLSDNTASNLLITHFGFDAINAAAHRAGMHHTHLLRHFLDYSAIVHHMDNRTTPADMAHLLYQIEHGAREGIVTVAPPAQCRAMLTIMLGQTDRTKIPAGLPPGTACANKTGEVDGVRNDVAVVEPFGDSPYVLTVFTKQLANYSDAYAGIANISRAAYAHVAGTDL
ncbi:MAG: class A beta-lactamase-related serine hydrolase [Candidatus Eremiobacteraeota bacterium]|nr:class A beta-lactamase-related serine hydrolase [Candidatus Eremiobacteraeota bacterium]